DTIAAISTAVGPGGISVVRVSGPNAFFIAETVTGIRPPDCASFPFARFAHFRNPVEGVAADNGILIFFKAPRSYTGEDVVEFQGHGGRMPSSLVLAAVLAAGARQADPGEFTRRAFLNGKIDLARAEAVMDFIGAASVRAAAAAREQLEGALSAKVGAIYEAIVSVEADVEHLLDFEEGEIGDSFLHDALARCRAALSETEALLATWRTGTMLREGALVVICGKPNAGKSSLLNALLGRDRAIVSPVAGTTRDAIEEPFQVEGVPVRLVDTAGLRSGAGEIEAEGIARAEALVERAAVAVEVIDATEQNWREDAAAALDKGRVAALNKIDAATPAAAIDAAGIGAVAISAKTGAGLDSLLGAIAARLDLLPGGEGEVAVSERHRRCLAEARGQLVEAVASLECGGDGLVPAASSLATAARALGEITGRVWSGDLLDSIFSRFCVGK
ncbi:MAG: tRNA uridine-5-carboxymethylaminomethyl(34) synthesis GTPase MnmE, partial [Kiritimatiellae bacterium]|nr:tRNA uridine-5-carboxymethylaminomethyl(34) synthesis GTPase MnmE [Kiritimatiellia bacterium]